MEVSQPRPALDHLRAGVPALAVALGWEDHPMSIGVEALGGHLVEDPEEAAAAQDGQEVALISPGEATPVAVVQL